MDRAVVRYEEASECLDAWIATRHLGNESARFRAVSAIEDCINLTRRAVLHAQAGVERGIIDPNLTPPSSERRSIKEMRDAIQHTEERVLGTSKFSPIMEGEYYFPAFGDSDVVLGSQRLAYSVLASVIVDLHCALDEPPFREHTP